MAYYVTRNRYGWDSQAYLTRRASLPILPYKPKIEGALVTPCAPFCTTMAEILHGKDIGDKKLNGILGYMNALNLNEDEDKYEVLSIIKNKEELGQELELECCDDNVTKILLGLHHPPTDYKRSALKILRDYGIISTTLAFELDNIYGGGFANSKTPLSKRGIKLIKDLGKNGIIVDLSHSGHQTAIDVMNLIKGGVKTSVMASHTGSYEVYNHNRNLPDQVLKDIADAGGVIGVYCLTFGLHESDDTLEPFYNHLQHIINICGEDAVCIGTDSVYECQNLEALKQWSRDNIKLLDPRGNFKARFPEAAIELNTPNMLEIIKNFLMRKGMDFEMVEKIIDSNFKKFLLRTL